MSVERDSTSTWDTFPCHHTVLMACRTLTSTIRLLETYELFRDDFRLRFVFTVDNGSRFGAGAEQLLRRAGVHHILDWASVSDVKPDLTLAASENVDTEVLGDPVIVLPHGVGFNKYVPTDDVAGRRLAGLPDPAALRSGRVRVVLAHPGQDAQLRAVCPDIAGRTVVTGDPTLDRIAASMPLRDRYRELLHSGDQRLVLVSSTWSGESLMGRWRTLPADLLAALPADRFRVCLALHPNVWDRHGPHAIRVYLARALDAGLILLPPESAWQAAMVASDVVVADHGSLSLYAAALDKPLLLVGPAEETVPGTPMAALLDAAHRLDEHQPLADQIENARAHPAFQDIAGQAFGHRGQATERLRRELYRVLGLAPPHEPGPLLRVADPVSDRSGPWSYRVHGIDRGDTVALTRYPASVRKTGDDHLVVTDDETDLRLFEQASVLCRERPTDHARAEGWATSALTAYPGARLAAAGVPGGCLVVTRTRRQAVLTGAGADVAMLGSVAYLSLLAERFEDRDVTLTIAGRRLPVNLTTR